MPEETEIVPAELSPEMEAAVQEAVAAQVAPVVQEQVEQVVAEVVPVAVAEALPAGSGRSDAGSGRGRYSPRRHGIQRAAGPR